MKLARFQTHRRAFCFDGLRLRHVIETPRLSGAPGAPDWMVGAYNHFGRAVAAVDIGALHGLTAPNREPPLLLLVECEGELLALPADHLELEYVPPPFSRRGHLLEVVDRRTNLLFVDLARLSEAVRDALIGPSR